MIAGQIQSRFFFYLTLTGLVGILTSGNKATDQGQLVLTRVGSTTNQQELDSPLYKTIDHHISCHAWFFKSRSVLLFIPV